MQHAFGNIGDGIQLEQERKKAGYDTGMQNAYGNIGDGIKAEQEGKAIEANQAYYKSFTEDAIGGKPEDKEKPITPTQSYLDDLLNAGGKGMPRDGEEGNSVLGKKPPTDYLDYIVSADEKADEPTSRNAYGQYVGGVEGNYKPPALREAEQAVTAFDIAFNKIEELTGESGQAAILANIADNSIGIDGAIDEDLIWGQAAILLAAAQEQTGMTLDGAETFLSEETEKFEDQKRSDMISNDPLFNITSNIKDQTVFGITPFGSKGNASDNCCGVGSVQNALVGLGENPNFADVYNYFDDDSKLVLGELGGGVLGTDPFAVMDYLESEGYDVTIKDFNPKLLEEPGTYIMVYGWQGDDGNISAHFMAATSDGTTVKTYNNDYEYYIGDTNSTGDATVKPLNEIVKDTKMIRKVDNTLLNAIFGTNDISHVPLPFKNQIPGTIKNLIKGDYTSYSWVIQIS